MSSENSRGVTLVEALVAVAIVGIVLAATVPAFVGNLRINTDNETRSGAVTAAQTVMDRLRGDAAWPEYGGSPGGPALPPVVTVEASARSYDVRIDYGPYCDDAGTCYAGARRVELEVTHDGRVFYRVATVFTQLD